MQYIWKIFEGHLLLLFFTTQNIKIHFYLNSCLSLFIPITHSLLNITHTLIMFNKAIHKTHFNVELIKIIKIDWNLNSSHFYAALVNDTRAYDKTSGVDYSLSLSLSLVPPYTHHQDIFCIDNDTYHTHVQHFHYDR